MRAVVAAADGAISWGGVSIDRCFRADYYTPRKQSTPAPRPTPRPGAQSHRALSGSGRALRAEGRVGVVRGRNLCAEARSVCCFADAGPRPLEHMRGRGSRRLGP